MMLIGLAFTCYLTVYLFYILADIFLDRRSYSNELLFLLYMRCSMELQREDELEWHWAS